MTRYISYNIYHLYLLHDVTRYSKHLFERKSFIVDVAILETFLQCIVPIHYTPAFCINFDNQNNETSIEIYE